MADDEAFWPRLKKRWRAWLRAVHRDVGYLVVGMTVVYALSGIAVNHLQDWDPNFVSYERTFTIAPIAASVPDGEAITRAEAALRYGKAKAVLRAGDELRFEYDDKKVTIIGEDGTVIEQGRSARFFFRAATWLHVQRGKPAWRFIADGFAVLLLYLAISGMFMLKGKLGMRWRGAILVTLGALVPILYVLLSGGPQAAKPATLPSPTAVPAPSP